MNPCGRSPSTLFSTPVSTSRSIALTSSQAPIRLSRRLCDPMWFSTCLSWTFKAVNDVAAQACSGMSNPLFGHSIQADDVICGTVSVEFFNQGCMAPQNVALADRTLVRQFAGIDRELCSQERKTHHALGTATCFCCQRRQFGAQTRLHPFIIDNLRRGRNAKDGDVVPIFSGDYQVAQLRRQMLQQMRPERANADPRAGGQLKILREASVVAETALLISGFRPVERVAGSQESVFVESIRSEIVSSPVTWSYAWALNSHFHFAVRWRELQRDTGRRQADAAGRDGGRMPMGRDGTGLGRAEHSDPPDALTDRFECKFVKRVADMLSDTCSGILQDPNTAEKALPQRAVTTQPRDQFLGALRDIRIEQWRDVAQVTNGLLDLSRQGLAVINIQRPTIKQCDAETYGATEDMVPRQPIDEHGKLLGKRGVTRKYHLQGAAPHPVRVDHTFRNAGRTRGK